MLASVNAMALIERAAAKVSLPKLESLQVGRGLAALAVLLFHSEIVALAVHPHAAVASLFDLGFTGVDFFFLLSGFLMVWVHRGDFDQPSRVMRYFGKRVTRIYPVYWVLCAVLIPVTLRLPALRQNQIAPSASSLIASLLLLPSQGPRLLGVTWTLEYELLFYLAFSLFFFSSRAAVGLFGVWFVAIVGAAIWGPLPLVPTGAPQLHPWWIGFLLNLHIVEFFLGMVLAWMVQRGVRLRRPALLLGLGIGLVVAVNVVAFVRGSETLSLDQGHRVATIGAGLIAALIVFSAVQMEQGRPFAVPAALRLLGAASYSIYLTHFLVISFVRVVALRSARIGALPPALLLAFIVVVGLVPGLLLHLLVERPLLRVTSRWLRGRSIQPAAEI